jgi:3-phosphoglycerate kinase
MAKLTIKDIELKGKKVLLRADFNVPQDAELKITDDTRIKATLPTLKYILENGARKLILISHLGRPDGKVVEKYSLKPIAQRLEELLGVPVKFLTDCVGDNIKKEIEAAEEKVILLENLRFHTEGVAHYLKSAAGFLLGKEIEYLGNAVANPGRPFVVILGGAKVSDKIGVIDNLLPKCDAIIIGGGMAYTFLKAQGKTIGNSKLEKDKVDLAKTILAKAVSLKKEIVLPVDNIVVEAISPDARAELVGENIPEGKIAVDIGPKTIALFKEKLQNAKTIVWNGPLGIFEMEAFSKGYA